MKSRVVPFGRLGALVLVTVALVTPSIDPGRSHVVRASGDPPIQVRGAVPIRCRGVTIRNFGVVDGRVYRGAEPSEAQLEELVRLGVRTVVDASTEPDRSLRIRSEQLGLKFKNVPLRRRRTPDDESVAAFLRIATDPALQPVFVCCKGGRHRTGSLVAVYRIAVNGWTVEEALREMDAYGFYSVMWLHDGFKRVVVEYDRRLRSLEAPRP